MTGVFFYLFCVGASWFHSDELEMDGTATMIPRREPIKAVKVHQVGVNFTVFSVAFNSID